MELWARKKKREEEKAKKDDISNSDFFRSVSGFFKEPEPEPEPEPEKGGLFGFFRRRSDKEEPKKEEAKASSRWGFFRRSSDDEEPKEKPPETSESPTNIFRDATNLVKDAASFKSAENKEETLSKEQKMRIQEEKKKQKEARKEAAEKAKEEDGGSPGFLSSSLRRVQEFLPSSSNTTEKETAKSPENSNPLSVVQKIAGSIWKSDDEEWIPVFQRHESCRVKVFPSRWPALIFSWLLPKIVAHCTALPILVLISEPRWKRVS